MPEPIKPEIKVTIGEEEKTYSAEDVAKLVADKGELEVKIKDSEAQTLAGATILEAAGRYEADAETYITQAEGAFAAVAKLSEAGIIDDKGEPIKPKEPEPTKPDPPVVDPTKPKPDDVPTEDKVEAAVIKALKPLQEKTEQLEGDLSRMYRADLEKRLKEKHPSLDNADMPQLFSLAMNDQKKDLFGHAEAFVNAKGAKEAELKVKLAAELGVNMKEHEERNKLKELEAKTGPVVFAKGKGIKFSSRRFNKETDVSPLDAAAEFMRRKEEEG